MVELTQSLKRLSYTAADSMPIKLLKNAEFFDAVKQNRVLPLHLQLSPTNKCNLKCGFCSCKETDKNKELGIEELEEILHRFYLLHAKAITITGGGEPLMHPQINQLIECCRIKGIEVGLVTNGTLLDRLDQRSLDWITWLRISASDERRPNSKMEAVIKKAPNIDWAFSYVVTSAFDPLNLASYVDFANKNSFAHVRVVSDLIDLDSVPTMKKVEIELKKQGIDDCLVIYQGRKEYTQGARRCWISLLKPMVSADSKVYPCCGVQYAHREQRLDFPDDMSMGTTEDIFEIWNSQIPYEGSACHRCYYENYNSLIDKLLSKIEHQNFV